jgi:hypothetical protein
MKHTHHIIPRHAGGTDDPSNLVELTIEEHAEAHKQLYEQYGRWQDLVAYRGLQGLITEEERIEIMYAARRGGGNFFYGKKHTEETKRKISENRKGKGTSPKSLETRKKMSENNGRSQLGKEPWNKGKTGVQPKSLETKKKISVPVIFRNVEYYSIEEAAKKNNTSAWYVKKEVYGDGYAKARSVATSK